jgi:hypothetical protein
MPYRLIAATVLVMLVGIAPASAWWSYAELGVERIAGHDGEQRAGFAVPAGCAGVRHDAEWRPTGTARSSRSGLSARSGSRERRARRFALTVTASRRGYACLLSRPRD